MPLEPINPTPPPAQPISPSDQAPPPSQSQYAPEQPSSEPSAQALIRDAFASRGYDVSGYEGDEDLLSHLEQIAQVGQKIPELERFAALGRDVSPYLDQFQEWRRSQAQPQQPAAPAEPKWWDAPVKADVDRYAQLCDKDATTGRWAIKPELAGRVSSQVADDLNRYEEWQRKTSHKLLHEFPQSVQEAVADQLDQLRQEMAYYAQAAVDEYRQQYEAQAYIQKRQSDFYVLDDRGRVQTNPDGSERLTPKGQAMLEYAHEARAYGIQDPAQIRAYADRALERDIHYGRFEEHAPKKGRTQSQTEAPATIPLTPQQKSAAQKETFLANAIKNAEKGPRSHETPRDARTQVGAPPTGAEAAFLDFKAIAAEEAARLGVNLKTG
jgi:hypothetical protein